MDEIIALKITIMINSDQVYTAGQGCGMGTGDGDRGSRDRRNYVDIGTEDLNLSQGLG